MRTKISFDPISRQSIEIAIRKLEAYKRSVEKKTNLLCERLATLGATRVSIEYSRVGEIATDGKGIPEIEVENDGDIWKILANGEEAIFIEFGSGAKYGYGHPEPQDFGPGTYPSIKKHWDDPKGWYTPMGQHTYGNAPTAGMWQAREDIKDNLKRIAKEVFNG